ncbi:uncharacterized protein LOC142231342 [Haematobia irritans]|uniref:uncharacterized protein LOC142231342 n=1 Tax=Haematobia irritans TaxID=7368 RepID=UPI003F501298
MNGNILFVVAIVVLNAKPHESVILEKIICTKLDENFIRIDLCDLKRNKENVLAFSVSATLIKESVTDCLVNTEFYHVPYKNPLTNRTWDICKGLIQTRRNIPAQFILNILKNYSNINHPCPYQVNEPIEVRNIAPPQKMLYPVPPGKYNYKLFFIANGAKRILIDLYLKTT